MWTYTKTDWKPEDWFDYEEYNRIRANIEYLVELAFQLYPKWNREEIGTLGATSLYYAKTFNLIEENLELLASKTFRSSRFEGTRATVGNKEGWDSEDVNRIERTVRLFYGILTSQHNGANKLAFELGGDCFV